MKLTDAQMRAIELMIEQQERLGDRILYRKHESIEEIVHKFYETDHPKGFEMTILNKIGALLIPDTTEDLNLTIPYVKIINPKNLKGS